MLTGRYRFRRRWLFLPVLQEEHIDDDRLVWVDVAWHELRETRVFAIVRPSQWLEFMASRGKKPRPAPRRRKTDEAEVSRFSPGDHR